jgi:hypothetical protein
MLSDRFQRVSEYRAVFNVYHVASHRGGLGSSPVTSCEICGGQSGTGAGFLRVLLFPLPIFIPPIAPQSPPSIIWGWYNRPVVAAVLIVLSVLFPEEYDLLGCKAV